MSVILETRDLVRSFRRGLFASGDEVRAVDGVTLEVRHGETFALVGESGCGKSTLARLLLRLIEPSAGQVLYEDRDLATLDARQLRALRAEIQFIFQDPFSSLNPRMTVGALVGEPLLVHRKLPKTEHEARVAGLLERVGLRPDHARRYPHEFSGGQRQRIGIARALASNPKLLIGDEPVSALDVSVQAQIINLLEDLKVEFGLTLIVIAHDLAVIRHMSDRVAVMYLGQIVELSPVEALFDRPLHPYTHALMRAVPIPEPGRRHEHGLLSGDIPSPTAPPPGCRFHTRCPHVIEKCRVKTPYLNTAGADRFVACHRWQEIADQVPPPVQALPRAAQVEERFALYRAHAQNQDFFKEGTKRP